MNALLEPTGSFLDGTIMVHRINAPLDDHEKLYMTVGDAGLKLSDLFPYLEPGLPDPTLVMHPKIHHNQGENQRDPVSIENILHFDGTCEPIRTAATLVVARETEPGVPPTRFVSTPGFFALAKELGVFRHFSPLDVDAVFGYSAYYSQTQPFWLSLEPNSERLHEVIAYDLARDAVSSREELIRKLDSDPTRGKRRYPLVSPHSITGEDSIMIDAGARHIELASKVGGDQGIDERDLVEAFINLRLLLGDTELLDDAGLTAEVAPETGFAVAFPKEGLHNQQPPENQQAQDARRRMSVLGLVAFDPEAE